jgi:heme exporter protein D
MNEFFAMGGYGPYVWSAYGITLAALVFNYWAATRRLKHNLQRVLGAVREEGSDRKPRVRKL